MNIAKDSTANICTCCEHCALGARMRKNPEEKREPRHLAPPTNDAPLCENPAPSRYAGGGFPRLVLSPLNVSATEIRRPEPGPPPAAAVLTTQTFGAFRFKGLRAEGAAQSVGGS